MSSSRIAISLDREADTAYITLSDKKIVETRELTPAVMVDVDEMGVAVGVEVLNIDAKIPFDRLCQDFHVHSTVVDTLRLIHPDVDTFVNVTFASEGTSRPLGNHRATESKMSSSVPSTAEHVAV